MTNPSRGKLGSCLNESFAEKSHMDVPLVVLRAAASNAVWTDCRIAGPAVVFCHGRN